MEIPETPKAVEQLDLMRRLHAYATGRASWKEPRTKVGENERRACNALYVGIVELVNKVLAPLLDYSTK